MLNLRTYDGVVHLMKFASGRTTGQDMTECGITVDTDTRVEGHGTITDRKVTCVTCLAEEGQPWRTPR